MKTLKDHIILYDAVCPMCNLYTKGFVRTGMLNENGRLPYQTMPDNLACFVDQKRSVNEIALVEKETGKVYYGIESLLKIIGHSFPSLRPIFQNQLFVKISDKLYKFISFNRRVIAPNKKDDINSGVMDPSFHRGYRIAYLIFTWLAAALVLYKYSLRFNAILPESNFYREFLVCGGQLIWQLAAVLCLKKKQLLWDYLGNLMTISFAGGILLAIVMALGKLLQWHNPLIYLGLFGIVVFCMLLEHIRRTKLLGLGSFLTLSWIAYRIVVLFIILMPWYVH